MPRGGEDDASFAEHANQNTGGQGGGQDIHHIVAQQQRAQQDLFFLAQVAVTMPARRSPCRAR